MAQPLPPTTTAPETHPPGTVTEARARSPAHSDKTIVAPEHTRETPTGSYAAGAYFSTNAGEKPPRKAPGPPYPPVIVRGGDEAEGVWMFANYWRVKHPDLYHQVFHCDPPWAITDLWDDYDIHLETPEFLKKALYFIGNDNFIRARDYAVEWSRKNKKRLDSIARDMPHWGDPNDPLAIVNKIFIDGERQQYPRAFLFRVLSMMMQSMRTTAEKYHASKGATATQNVTQEDSSATGIAEPVAPTGLSAEVQGKQPQIAPPQGDGRRKYSSTLIYH